MQYSSLVDYNFSEVTKNSALGLHNVRGHCVHCTVDTDSVSARQVHLHLSREFPT
jgi:hypothetical protein